MSLACIPMLKSNGLCVGKHATENSYRRYRSVCIEICSSRIRPTRLRLETSRSSHQSAVDLDLADLVDL